MKKTLFTLVALAVMSSGAYAAVIFANNIDDTNPSAYNPFTLGQTVAANLTVTGIGRGSGLTGNAGGNRYNATAWSTAFDTNDYFTFRLTPNAGYAIDFTNLVYTGQASGTGPTSFVFRSSLDGFTANIGSASASSTIDLSGAAYNNITTAIEFRLYGFGGTSASGTYSVNDFTFNGSVGLTAVPEPHHYGIAFAALLGLIVLGRRRAKLTA